MEGIKTKMDSIATELGSLRVNTVQTSNQLDTVVQQLNNNPTLNGVNGGTTQTTGNSTTRPEKTITEFKLIDGPPRLTNDKKGYMNWLEQFKNAIDQVDPEMRILLEKIEDAHWGKQKRENGSKKKKR